MVQDAIVLKKYRDISKVVLFDNRCGRLTATCNTFLLSVGTVIRYSLPVQAIQDHYMFGRGCHISDYERIMIPKRLDTMTLSFLHHVIELCLYSVQAGVSDLPLFDMVLSLYTYCPKKWSTDIQRIFIMQLLLMLGFAVEDALLVKNEVIQLCTMPIDKIFDGTIHLDSIQPQLVHEIDRWIQLCLARHPYSDQFKTVRFFYTDQAGRLI